MYTKYYNMRSRKRTILFIYCFLISLIFFRYFYLQLIKHEKFLSEAGNNSLRKLLLVAPRGLIFDRKENFLVDNQLIYDINIIPKDFEQETFNYTLIEKELGISKTTIDSIVLPMQKNRVKQFLPLLIKRHVDLDVKAILEEHKLTLKGLYFSKLPARKYSSESNLTHVLGFLKQENQEIIGRNGLEKYYQNKLKGENGVEYHLVDIHGIDQGKYYIDKNYNPLQGDSLILSIDNNLQHYCENITEGYKGAIIVMNPKNGEVYSMNSFPDYNLDSFIGPIPQKEWDDLNKNKDNVFSNRAIQNTYPPGSIFKLLLSSIALEHKIINKNWSVSCNGAYDFFDTRFHCWKEGGHGEVNMQEAIQQSCNVYFYNLMQKVDFNLWYEESVKFGFNQLTHIDLPHEKIGLIPNKKYMNQTYKNRGGWSTGHLLNLSIGQGEILVTPIQIINLINIISNEGYSYQPHLNINAPKIKSNRFYNSNVFKHMKKGMYDAVYKFGGTAYNAKPDNSQAIAYGKTGTVQLCSNCEIEPHGWFGGILEMKNGKTYTVCILIENGGKGSGLPSVLAKKIFNFIVNNNV